MSAEAFRKNEAYCREKAQNSVLPEKWIEKANEWAALAEKLEAQEKEKAKEKEQAA